MWMLYASRGAKEMSADDSTETQLAEVLERIRALPPMTAEERIEQAIDFAYGNLTCSTNHRQTKEAVAAVKWKMEWRKLRDAVCIIRGMAEHLDEKGANIRSALDEALR
jgi:hypothetical protein